MNIGLFAYPLVEAIWPSKGMIYFGMVDIGGAIIMFGITYFVGSYFSEGSDQFNFKFLGKISSISPISNLYDYVWIEHVSYSYMATSY